MHIVAEFDASKLSLRIWRAVEAQYQAATMVLVDTLDEQALLETILDEAKPPIGSASLQSLHWLLFTPFRYPPLPSGSRFRGPADPGVFYGADHRRTACAELGYWRWRFLRDSKGMETLGPMQQTVFLAEAAGAAIDLREPPWNARRAEWTAPSDYSSCQALARTARENDIAIIRYQSVRDPQAGACAALLTYQAFTKPRPIETQTWMLAVYRQRVIWKRDSVFEGEGFEFDALQWPS